MGGAEPLKSLACERFLLKSKIAAFFQWVPIRSLDGQGRLPLASFAAILRCFWFGRRFRPSMKGAIPGRTCDGILPNFVFSDPTITRSEGEGVRITRWHIQFRIVTSDLPHVGGSIAGTSGNDATEELVRRKTTTGFTQHGVPKGI